MGNRRSKTIETVRSEIRRFNWDFVHEYSNFNTTEEGFALFAL